MTVKCFCSGHCPDNRPNGTCLARAASMCFTAIEQVFNHEHERFENEITYGCLPPDESGLMQCKGHLVPHQVPKSILCCDDFDFCNKELKPFLKDPIPEMTGPAYLQQYIYVALSLLFILIILLIIQVVFQIYKRKKSEHYPNDKKNLYSNEKSLTSLIDQNVSSGSGSGAPLLVQRTIGKQIELIKSIGKGRYGEVWKANWRNENLAVKIFFTTEENSWYRETAIYQTVLLRHSNILGFVASDIRGTGSWTQMLLITDYHENGSLHDYLKLGSFDAADVLKMAYTAICGICHLHAEICGKQGKPAIAHRDIKSKNILVKKDGSCVIADLNLAIRNDIYSQNNNTVSNVKVGTKRYMSPEILDDTIVTNNFEAFKMADIYSFSLVLWEIGRRCEISGCVDEYNMPYQDVVPSDPSFEDMRKVVCVDQQRPSFSKRWSCEFVLEALAKIIKESWSQNPTARLTALRIKKSLSKLQTYGTKAKDVKIFVDIKDKNESIS